MRPLLLSRLSRLCLRKPPPLETRHLGGGARFFSESPLCHIVGGEQCGSGDIGNLIIRDYTVFSPGIMVSKKIVPMDLVKENGTIGASHGWVATLKDGVVCLQDDLNPSASDSRPNRIELPRLVTLPDCQTQLVTNIAMSSSSPDQDKDCIVAVKFAGPQLSLGRPAEYDWVNYKITDPGFFSSRVMYSKSEKRFKMAASGGTHIGSWNLEKHKTHSLWFPFSPKFSQSEWEQLSTCCKREHLVDSPINGETYMVKWYTRCCEKTGRAVWERFLTYRIITNDFPLSVDDIGDLSIFLSSKGEPFCLQASLYGLTPNCIYYVDNYDFGKVNIRDNVRVGDIHICPAPYFIPPQP